MTSGSSAVGTPELAQNVARIVVNIVVFEECNEFSFKIVFAMVFGCELMYAIV